ncbi:hypothetical protein FJU08_11250 [Martelella alba]|uniref:Tat pathway signal sequence domain protein n=1 Tax=Martelella alba TaxID=2590451 RepID=A0A506UCZ3_9HYPH|nr:hypothetical protein [Martelella alba]TPW30539.1 hypothetical protein FJU08_11250 [Martelella alba]
MRQVIAVATAVNLLAGTAFAEVETTAKTVVQAKAVIALELNAAATTEKGCKLTFVVENGLTTPITSLKAEVALFNADGVVDRMTMLDFLDLPVGKRRVRQFELPGAPCESLSGLLLNDVKVCEGGGDQCAALIETRSKASIGFDG